MTQYARLVELARRERELVTDGRLVELPALHAERERLVASLPAQAPPEARPHLERALALTAATGELLAHGLAGLKRELGAVGNHRRVAASYTGVAPAMTLDATA
jgi:hypothetical protein